jgi:hypothetical protein
LQHNPSQCQRIKKWVHLIFGDYVELILKDNHKHYHKATIPQSMQQLLGGSHEVILHNHSVEGDKSVKYNKTLKLPKENAYLVPPSPTSLW